MSERPSTAAESRLRQVGPTGGGPGLTSREAATKLRAAYPAHGATGACAACGGTRTGPFTWEQGFRIAECRDCAFLWVDPVPSGEDMWSYYNERSWKPYPPEVARKKFAPSVQVVSRLLPRGATVLDVGADHGHFAGALQERGFRVTGVDIDGQALAYAHRVYGIPVHQCELTELRTEERFDAVTILSSLEHMVNPYEVMAAARHLLRPGGLLIVSTPVGDGLVPAFSRRFLMRATGTWELLSPPSHLTFFNRRSLTAMLHRAGFGQPDFHYQARSRAYKQRELSRALAESPAASSWVRPLYLRLHWLLPLGRLLGRGDMTYCVAATDARDER